MGVVVNFLHRRSVGEVVNSDSHNYMHTASVSILVLQIHTAAYVRSTFHEMNVLRRFSEVQTIVRKVALMRRTIDKFPNEKEVYVQNIKKHQEL